jgi:hypothetical protein
MGKYLNVDSRIYGIFSSAGWMVENIKTYPSNYVAGPGSSEFIRVTIIPSGSGINLRSVSGVVIVDIFVEAGKGPKRVSTVADKLDTYMSGKSISTAGINVQLGSSSLSLDGIDPDDAALFRATYTIPFNYFEVM